MTLDFAQYQALTGLYARYVAAVDEERWQDWASLFTEDCVYRIQPRENYEAGLPLATLSFESKGMLLDRAYAIEETLFHDPYYQRHVVGLPVIHEVQDGRIACEANYAVFRTKQNELSSVFNVGRYIDTVVLDGDTYRFASRQCIFDSEMIPNSLIYPI